MIQLLIVLSFAVDVDVGERQGGQDSANGADPKVLRERV
jgi:hypothetical protein